MKINDVRKKGTMTPFIEWFEIRLSVFFNENLPLSINSKCSCVNIPPIFQRSFLANFITIDFTDSMNGEKLIVLFH
jgi:hypothetical protein